MKTSSERPNIWHLIVTLAAMFYLSCLTRSLTQTLYAFGEHGLVQNDIILNTVGGFLGILILLTWIFLLRDLIKQVTLFLRKKSQ